jgi:hypothetical protein
MRQTPRSRRWARASVAALGLSAATALIAMASRGPLSRSTPVDAASARAPVTALLMLLAGSGIVGLTAVAMLSWPRRRRKSDDEPEHEPEALRMHWIWKLLAAMLPLALGATLIAAAVLGTRSVNHVPRLGVGGRSFGPVPTAPARSRAGSGEFVVPGWLPWAALAIVFVAAVGALLVVLRRAEPVATSSEQGAACAAVDAAIGALHHSADPRSALIAAYAAMERALTEHGIARSRAEAPREYLQRVVVVASGAGLDASTLTGLFEQARFSTHPIPERSRAVALSALGSLRARLEVASSG